MRLILLFLLFSVSVHAQEFNFSVKINTQKLQTVDPKVFLTLEQSINEFLNTTRWTENNYQPYERIKGNFLLIFPARGTYLCLSSSVNMKYNGLTTRFIDWMIDEINGKGNL